MHILFNYSLCIVHLCMYDVLIVTVIGNLFLSQGDVGPPGPRGEKGGDGPEVCLSYHFFLYCYYSYYSLFFCTVMTATTSLGFGRWALEAIHRVSLTLILTIILTLNIFFGGGGGSTNLQNCAIIFSVRLCEPWSSCSLTD